MEKLSSFKSFTLNAQYLKTLCGGQSDTVNVNRAEKKSQAGPDETGKLGNCTDDIVTETDDNGNTIETCEQWTCEN